MGCGHPQQLGPASAWRGARPSRSWPCGGRAVIEVQGAEQLVELNERLKEAADKDLQRSFQGIRDAWELLTATSDGGGVRSLLGEDSGPGADVVHVSSYPSACQSGRNVQLWAARPADACAADRELGVW